MVVKGDSQCYGKIQPTPGSDVITTEKQMVPRSKPICSLSVGSFPGGKDRAIANFFLTQERLDFCISENILLFVMIRLYLIYITTETLGQTSNKGRSVGPLWACRQLFKLKMSPLVRQFREKKVFEYDLSTGL